MFKDTSKLIEPLVDWWKANTEAYLPSLGVQAGSECVVLAGRQHTPSLAPDKTVKHADRFPVLSVCQASFLYMWTALEEKQWAVLGNDKTIDLSLLFSSALFLLKNNHFELLLDIYYSRTAVVNCKSTWKSPFFPLPMICRSSPNLSGVGWLLLWFNSPKSNNTLGLCQIPIPQCACFPHCWNKECRFVKQLKG